MATLPPNRALRRLKFLGRGPDQYLVQAAMRRLVHNELHRSGDVVGLEWYKIAHPLRELGVPRGEWRINKTRFD